MDGSFSIAVHALAYLNHKKDCITSQELAGNICTNPARVRKIMAMLGKAGLVDTRAGHEGGYCFAGRAETLTLERVAEAVDANFVSAVWRSGNADMACLIASGMADVMDGIYRQLDQLCRKKLKDITIADIDRRIFDGGREPVMSLPNQTETGIK